ncbi:EscU/YscU/HrcU family type III secretion system export apparatus switch protein [Streptomyces sp. YC504]|uniref:EscU/YscU/HrcU family type III secretion system export apparatus switch protein n=1 Tax=Streptomyces mesophilus TaxID=1775132 RepID=A0A6G4XGS6_9ACTN|nr:EscU/YscU/HrcU family type III secretion system export apparatus switch protein [Streptomyces mesophilus]
MLGNTRLAATLLRGSNRREWWRIGLTGLASLLATVFALMAILVASITWDTRLQSGTEAMPVADRYSIAVLNDPGVRPGFAFAIAMLLVPVLGFLAQTTRVGAVHRDRRFANLRLAGATPRQVRSLAAVEAGLTCLAGAVAGLLLFLGVHALFGRLQSGRVLHWPSDVAVAWPAALAVVLAVPLAVTLLSVLVLHRVVTSPLGVVRRARKQRSRGFYVVFVLCTAGAYVTVQVGLQADLVSAVFPVLALVAVVLVGVGAVASASAFARSMGGALLKRAQRPDVLIAAGRLKADPWASARIHGTLLLVTVAGVILVGVRALILSEVDAYGANDDGYYSSGINLIAAALLVATVIALLALLTGTAESLITRRRALAAQSAAGVPQAVLRRAVLLETALPLAPAMLVAGVGGVALYVAYGGLMGRPLPLLSSLLVPVGVYAACLLATACTLPLLRRALHPAELRYE